MAIQNGSGLSWRQERAIAALLTQSTVVAAASAAGVGTRTLEARRKQSMMLTTEERGHKCEVSYRAEISRLTALGVEPPRRTRSSVGTSGRGSRAPVPEQ